MGPGAWLLNSASSNVLAKFEFESVSFVAQKVCEGGESCQNFRWETPRLYFFYRKTCFPALRESCFFHLDLASARTLSEHPVLHT